MNGIFDFSFFSGKTMDAEEMEGVEETSNVESYECVICTKKEESTENSPLGLIVLLQPSTGMIFTGVFRISLSVF